MRSLALALLVVLLAGAVGWLLFGGEAPVQTVDGVVVEESDGETADGRAAPSLVEAGGQEVRRAVEGTGEAAQLEAKGLQLLGAEVPTKAARVFGELVVIGEEGRPLGAFDGNIHLESKGLPLVLEVLAGRFDDELQVSEDVVRVRVVSVEVLGLEVQLAEDYQSLATGSSEPQVVTARVVPDLRLRVVDAQTGMDLQEAWLVPGHGGFEALLASPLSGIGGAAWKTSSPVDLGHLPSQFDNWFDHILVGAEGYAWQRLFVDLTHGGEVFVRLVAGADQPVVVQLLAADLTTTATSALVLTGQGGELDGYTLRLELDDRERQHFLLDGMTPGAYTLTVERQGTEVLATRDVVLTPGANPPVELLCVEPTPEQLAELSIVLIRPGSWGPEPPTAKVRRSDLEGEQPSEPLTVTSLGGDRWSLGHPGLAVGEYRLSTGTPHTSTPFVLPPGGLFDHVVRLPATFEVTLEFVDATTGEPRVLRNVSWHSYTDAPMLTGRTFVTGNVRDDDGDGLVTLTAPEGTLHLDLYEGMHLVDNELEVHSDGQHFQVRASSLCFFTLALTEEGRSLPFDQFTSVMSVLEIDGPGELVHFELDPGSFKVALTATGTYTVTLSEGSTYLAAGPFEVIVPEMGSPRLEIELVRRTN